MDSPPTFPDSWLYERFGTTSPWWKLAVDSNALLLSAPHSDTSVAIPLETAQAARIRALSGVTSQLLLPVDYQNHVLTLHFVGKKVSDYYWSGTVSEYQNLEAVAQDLTHGLAFAEQVVSEVNSLVVILDTEGRICRFNKLCEELSGIREVDVLGKSAHQLFVPKDEHDPSLQNIRSFFTSGVSFEVERPIITVTGPRQILWRNKLVQGGSGPSERYLICSGTDVTEERRAQSRLIELANTDMLTGLPNRHSIHSRISQALDENQRDFGLLFLDLDNFKRINDHYGHVKGDLLIQEVAKAISRSIGPGDTLARLGGDEFLILATGCNHVDDAIALSEKVLAALQEPFSLGFLEVYTGCSIGIAMCPQQDGSLEELIRSADTAMYVAKDAGRCTYRVFDPAMNEKAARYMWLDNNLRRALECNQLELYYQPKVSATTGEVLSVEALLRWNSPEKGLLGPAEFIPFAEESGMIIPIGKWIFEEAARQAAAWQALDIPLRIAVNVSARQLLDDSIINAFSNALKLAGLDECLVDIEMTESCLADDEDMARSLVEKFRSLGAQVHLDDFGTGYSSLAHLVRFPFDVIKLDRSFIMGIHDNPKSEALVRTSLAIAEQLNFKTVAEGVETAAEADFLCKLGVTQLQGYLFTRPLPAGKLTSWLTERTSSRRGGIVKP